MCVPLGTGKGVGEKSCSVGIECVRAVRHGKGVGEKSCSVGLGLWGCQPTPAFLGKVSHLVTHPHLPLTHSSVGHNAPTPFHSVGLTLLHLNPHTL